jgi:hypothetical protein
VTTYVDDEGTEFELTAGWHEYTYRKAGKEYRIAGESIVGGLGDHSHGRVFWLSSEYPAQVRQMIRRDIENAYKLTNGLAEFG